MDGSVSLRLELLAVVVLDVVSLSSAMLGLEPLSFFLCLFRLDEVRGVAIGLSPT